MLMGNIARTEKRYTAQGKSFEFKLGNAQTLNGAPKDLIMLENLRFTSKQVTPGKKLLGETLTTLRFKNFIRGKIKDF